MRAHEIKDYHSVLQTLGEPGCPICTFLKNVQARLLQQEPLHEIVHLCNFHAWGIAAVRQTEDAAKIFRSLMEMRTSSAAQECSICLRLEQEEIFRVQELIANLATRSVSGWLSKHGVLCLPHGGRLRAEAPAHLRDLVDAAIRRSNQEMRNELDILIREAARGSAAHNGTLGRAAEYLVAQRGLISRRHDVSRE